MAKQARQHDPHEKREPEQQRNPQGAVLVALDHEHEAKGAHQEDHGAHTWACAHDAVDARVEPDQRAQDGGNER
jgi:hypothetical protein